MNPPRLAAPHPMPLTIAFIYDGLKRLRVNSAEIYGHKTSSKESKKGSRKGSRKSEGSSFLNGWIELFKAVNKSIKSSRVNNSLSKMWGVLGNGS